MRKQDELPARQLSQSSLDGARRPAVSDFEVVSWFALVGASTAIYLTIAFPGFDSLAALSGQFP